MKFRLVNAMIAVAVSALLAFGLWSFNGELKNYVAVGTFLTLVGTLMPLMGLDMRLIGTVLIWIAAFLTLLSMAYYLRAAWPQMLEKK